MAAKVLKFAALNFLRRGADKMPRALIQGVFSAEMTDSHQFRERGTATSRGFHVQGKSILIHQVYSRVIPWVKRRERPLGALIRSKLSKIYIWSSGEGGRSGLESSKNEHRNKKVEDKHLASTHIKYCMCKQLENIIKRQTKYEVNHERNKNHTKIA
ncbi:hypothetical protein B0H13DRAFT_1856597 [Mycena leptocephala]|nr:hypothetical protein B0H13DRAFT_1856597 [Mycena leptocephala]